MDFGEILTKAWQIIWKYKVLWIFGIFAGCSSGGGGGGGGSSSNVQFSGDPYTYGQFNRMDPWLIATIIGFAILLMVFVIAIVMILTTIGRIGLIQGTVKADEDENAEITFMGLIESMKPYFWRVLGLNLLIGVAIFILVMLIMVFFMVATLATFGIGLFCLIPLMCLMIPVAWVFSTFIEMTNVAVVVEDLSIQDGLKRGWEVFKENIGNLIVIGLILVVGGMLIGMLLAIPMIMTMVPLMMGIISAIAGKSEMLAASSIIISGLCCVAYLPVLIVLGGIVKAYVGSAWTLTYLRLTQGPKAADADIEPLAPEPLPEVVSAEALSEDVEVEPEPGDDSIPRNDF